MPDHEFKLLKFVCYTAGKGDKLILNRGDPTLAALRQSLTNLLVQTWTSHVKPIALSLLSPTEKLETCFTSEMQSVVTHTQLPLLFKFMTKLVDKIVLNELTEMSKVDPLLFERLVDNGCLTIE